MTAATLNNGILERIKDPESFFRRNSREFLEVVSAVRSAFGTTMTEQDIYDHVTQPKKVFLLRNTGGIFGMCSYTPKMIGGESILYIDGIAIDPRMQGQGIFRNATLSALEDEKFLGLKTQNPRMYRALQKFCDRIYPNESLCIPEDINKRMEELAKTLAVKTDEKKVIRGIYGRSLYPQAPVHHLASNFFDNILNVDYRAGDSVLCLGMID